jgi:ComF family protein
VPGSSVGDKAVVHAQALVRGAAAIVLDFALPPRCPGCGAITGLQHSFCVDCWRALDFLAEPCCVRCGLPFAYAQGDGVECGSCISAPPAFDRLRAAVAYGPIARQVALKLKYGGRPGVAETLARLLQRQMSGFPDDALIAPVPLHRWRIWKRGYNQAALIASALARHGGRPLTLDLLERIKPTPSMRGLGRRERALAVRGAFRVRREHKDALGGRSVLLVDDVYTSGATANACARALKKAGAGQVNIICWARVVSGDDR